MKAIRTALLICALAALNLFAADPVTVAATVQPPVATNGEAATNKSDKSMDLQLEFGSDKKDMPAEILSKLSPDQILELERIKSARSSPEDFLIPMAFFGCVIGIVAIVVVFRFKRQKMLHETVRTMIEKGAPIPPELLQPAGRPRRPRSDVRAGLILIAIGVSFLIVDLSKHQSIGLPALVPALMGIAFLVASRFDKHKNGNGNDNGQP